MRPGAVLLHQLTTNAIESVAQATPEPTRARTTKHAAISLAANDKPYISLIYAIHVMGDNSILVQDD